MFGAQCHWLCNTNDCLLGLTNEIHAERDRKLEEARARRKQARATSSQLPESRAAI